MNTPQAEGNVNSCLYSRGRSSNKLHEEYEEKKVQHYSAMTKIKDKCVFLLSMVELDHKSQWQRHWLIKWDLIHK